MLNYATIRSRNFPDVIHQYDERDTILYALGLGYGANPTNEDELRFVFEPRLKCVPTQAAVLGSSGFFWREPGLGADWVKIVHGEQDIRWYGQLPASATVIGRNRVESLTDKGPGKGAIAQVVREVIERDTGRLIAEVRQVTFLRGDGGFSGEGGQSDPPPAALPRINDDLGPPHRTVELATLPQSALIYRLSGDLNPLHADPETARAAGFDRPILHGLCTYGMAARALLGTYLDYDTSRLKRLAARFTAPVVPGETLTFQFWKRSENEIAFRASIDSRDAIVLNNGIAEIS